MAVSQGAMFGGQSLGRVARRHVRGTVPVCGQNRPVRGRLPVSVGQLVVVAGVALFFVALRLDGSYWRDFGVPGGTGLYFLDLRFFTSAWECIRAGTDVWPTNNPCDPLGRR
jgi:hypothetical protein